MIKSKEININLALLRFIACCGIICLHTFGSMGNISNHSSFVMQYFCSVSVLLFFSASGYILLNRENSYIRIVKKICSIILLMFSWSFVYSMAAFILKKESFFTNIIYNFFGSIIQVGKFPFYWFFWALILIYLLTPAFSKVFRKTSNAIILTSLLILLNIISYSLNLRSIFINGFSIYDINGFHQVYKVWVFATYYCIGGLVGRLYRNLKSGIIILLSGLAIAFNVLLTWVAYDYLGSFMSTNSPEYHHDSPLSIIIVILILIVLLCSKQVYSESSSAVLFSKCSLGIFCLHGWMKNCIYKFIIFPNNTLDLCIVAILELIMSLLVWVVLCKVPIASCLVELKPINIAFRRKTSNG